MKQFDLNDWYYNKFENHYTYNIKNFYLILMEYPEQQCWTCQSFGEDQEFYHSPITSIDCDTAEQAYQQCVNDLYHMCRRFISSIDEMKNA